MVKCRKFKIHDVVEQTHTALNKTFKNVKRSTVKYDMVWMKDFPHVKYCKLLHTTHKHFGGDTTRATVIIFNRLL